MSDDKQGLPFRLFDSVLGRMKKLVDSGTDVAMQSVESVQRGEAGTAGPASTEDAGSVSRDEANGEASTNDSIGQTEVLSTPRPTETATAAPALATALDEEAKAAIAEHVGDEGGDVTDGLAIKDQSGRVPPDEELGPEPFTPQVGP